MEPNEPSFYDITFLINLKGDHYVQVKVELTEVHFFISSKTSKQNKTKQKRQANNMKSSRNLLSERTLWSCYEKNMLFSSWFKIFRKLFYENNNLKSSTLWSFYEKNMLFSSWFKIFRKLFYENNNLKSSWTLLSKTMLWRNFHK